MSDYVLVAQVLGATHKSPWHILMAGEAPGACPEERGLCRAKTQPASTAHVVQAGHGPYGGRLCDTCRRRIGHHLYPPYIAQGPRPKPPVVIESTADEWELYQSELIGEALHTAFRKGNDDPASYEMWKLIDGMDGEQWAMIVAFVRDGIAPILKGQEAVQPSI